MSEINVVPYIDVMLVLLVIFMVTAPLITTGILDLPEVSKTAPKKERVVTIEIRKNELFKIKLTGDKKVITVTKSTLVDKIKEVVNAEENLAVVISAEKNASRARGNQIPLGFFFSHFNGQKKLVCRVFGKH